MGKEAGITPIFGPMILTVKGKGKGGRSYIDIAQRLLIARADPNARTKGKGKGLLHLAFEIGDSTYIKEHQTEVAEMVSLLVDGGLDAHATNEAGLKGID